MFLEPLDREIIERYIIYFIILFYTNIGVSDKRSVSHTRYLTNPMPEILIIGIHPLKALQPKYFNFITAFSPFHLLKRPP